MWIIMEVYLIVLSIFDIRSRQIPTALLLLGSVPAVFHAALTLFGHERTPAEYAAALVPGVILLLLAFVTGKIGYGDGWVIAIIGLLLGYRSGMTVFFISLFLSGMAGILLLLLRKVNSKSTIPYIPFVTIAVVLVWFIRNI